MLRAGATAIGDTEPLQQAITIRHLLSHQAGLSHGVFDSGTFVFDAYLAAGTRRPDTTLAEWIEQLTTLPLLYQPGQGWQYSMATDVLARQMMRDQLPPERCVGFLQRGPTPSLGFGLGGAVTRARSGLQPNSPLGEFQWGGLAGTHWFISSATGAAGALMTQRFWGFWHPLWFEYKRRVYEALR